MRYPHQCEQLRGYPNEITMGKWGSLAAICCRKKSKAGNPSEIPPPTFRTTPDPRLLRVARFSEEAAVREAVVSPAGPSAATMKLTGGPVKALAGIQIGETIRLKSFRCG
jgi:hypothetical protein